MLYPSLSRMNVIIFHTQTSHTLRLCIAGIEPKQFSETFAKRYEIFPFQGCARCGIGETSFSNTRTIDGVESVGRIPIWIPNRYCIAVIKTAQLQRLASYAPNTRRSARYLLGYVSPSARPLQCHASFERRGAKKLKRALFEIVSLFMTLFQIAFH